MMSDEAFIKRTFELARFGLGTTWPNPLVGALIVKNGRVIAEGFHQRKSEAHAELAAIQNATESLDGATLYVNLEPCCHTNKSTPPCAQRIIAEKIKRVVIANLDPNPAVNGKGVELLRAHGIDVLSGVCEEAGEKLNEVFFTAQRQKRPFLHFKAAVTLDGRIALKNGESQWITGEEARAHVHEQRALHQVILTSGETVRRDNPRLTVRIPDFTGQQPWRAVISRKQNFDKTSLIFSDERVLLYSSLEDAMEDLYRRKLICCYLECGPALATEFLRKRLIDRVTLYQSMSFLGVGKPLFGDVGTQTLTSRLRLTNIETKWFDTDQMITGRLTCSQV